MDKLMKEVSEKLTQLVNNPEFVIEEQLTDFFPSLTTLQIPELLAPFYKHATQLTLRWSYKNEKYNHLRGDINLLPIEQVLGDWKNIVWFDYHEDSDPIRKFKIIDYFVNESVVGFFNEDGLNNELYFLNFGSKPQPLGINIEGYIALLTLTRGFNYWQSSLLFLRHNLNSSEHENLVQNGHNIFPDFSFTNFRSTYNIHKMY